MRASEASNFNGCFCEEGTDFFFPFLFFYFFIFLLLLRASRGGTVRSSGNSFACFDLVTGMYPSDNGHTLRCIRRPLLFGSLEVRFSLISVFFFFFVPNTLGRLIANTTSNNLPVVSVPVVWLTAY